MAEFRRVVTELGTNPASPLTEQERLWFESVLMYRRRVEALNGCVNFNLDNLENLFGLLDMEASLTSADDFLVAVSRAALVFTLVKTLELTRSPIRDPLLGHITAAQNEGNREEARRGTKDPAHPLRHYAMFAEKLRTHDAVVTFNYDTVLEESLLASSIGPDYGFGEFVWPKVTSSIPVLKLHGSVNFKEKSNGEVEVVDFELLHETTSAYYDGGTPLLVPPTWNKGALTSIIQTIWQEAARRLRNAARIIFIGYSLSETDLSFRYLLANSFLANQRLPEVLVFDPDPVTRRRYSGFFADILKNQDRYTESSAGFPNVNLH